MKKLERVYADYTSFSEVSLQDSFFFARSDSSLQAAVDGVLGAKFNEDEDEDGIGHGS
jgi:hypothetical protein